MVIAVRLFELEMSVGKADFVVVDFPMMTVLFLNVPQQKEWKLLG